MVDIRQLSLIAGAREARGLAVIIDVFRAFSVAAYCVSRGAREIVLVGETQDAFDLRKQRFPDALLIGEVNGRHIDGFDFGNSPTHVAESTRDFADKTLIQRTSAGTQGVVNADGADEIVLGSFLCAGALVAHIRQRNPATVSIVGMGDAGVYKTDEDEALSDYLAARLRGEDLPVAPYLERARNGQAGKRFDDNHPDAPRTDVDYCLQADKFDFALHVARENGLLVARKATAITPLEPLTLRG
ncbi:MAG: 2-phosphosulfolactate phosphatase [Chloroflexi bacterium]|nr:2-phosphosulfolactate phosphatase [Chloroflexota bacterium]